ncbi:hypothetical protein C8Q73DRAFT_503574 [Cubamyces lactineus]|nr:hypothetical protein C8Q73DRAFT_503574 [Cubamyces lactineus]
MSRCPETARLLGKSTSLVRVFFWSGFIVRNIRVGAVSWPQDNACVGASWSWMDNSAGQSPCEVGLDLLQPCGGPSGTAGDNAPCYCNSVVYSLWSACEYCHGEGYDTFADYLSDGQCSGISYGSYNGEVPANIVVPAWAFEFNPLPNNLSAIFDLQAARQVVNGKSIVPPPVTSQIMSTSLFVSSLVSSRGSSSPLQSSGTTSQDHQSSSPPDTTSQIADSTSDVSPTSRSPSTILPDNNNTPSKQTTSAAATTSPSVPESQTEPSWSSGPGSTVTVSPSLNMGRARTSMGAIIGAAVGAGAGICILAGIVFHLLRRCRHRRRSAAALTDDSSARKLRTDNSQYSESEIDGSVSAQSHTPMSTEQSTLSKTVPSYYTVRLYDPDDPTTFPPSLSEILGGERAVSAPGEWRDSRAQVSDSRDSEGYKVY